MKLKVEHITQFEYDAPVYETATEVRLHPANYSGGVQECESFQLEVEPAAHIFTYTDYFGNRVHNFSLLQSHSKLKIASRAVVRTRPGILPATEKELTTLYEYQAESRYIIFSPEVALFAARFPKEKTVTEPRELAEEICRTINQEFKYEKGVTTVNSPVSEVLEMKRGVCQDFAHLMITVCRCLELPTRYVSGYFYGGGTEEDREGASHAWCEVYCGSGQGWVGFDPTHSTLWVDEYYIKIGHGRDYADVTPVRGTYRGKAHESLNVLVRMTAVE
jgi:transglutaminase-like putative cysteine protease